jgi:glycosyltransferase 2 family protein
MRFDPPILTSENSAMLDPSGSPLAEAPPREPPARAGRPRLGRWGKRAIKAAIGLLVLWAVGRHVAKTWRDLSGRGQSLHVGWTWVAAAVALYLAGLCAFGAFFARVMAHSPTPVRFLPAMRAYLISHLGKYVPGKAMVVVLRVGLLSRYGARPATAAFATLYETLTMMAAGGLVAAAGFAVRPLAPLTVPVGFGRVVPVPLALLGLGLGAGFFVLVEPRVFPRLSAVVRVPFPGVGPDAIPAISHRLLGEGVLWSLLGWALLGMSQVAVIAALVPRGVAAAWWPVVVASVALATVAGFAVAVFPGGLVVREGVLMAALAPALGDDMAVVAALALRLAWVAGEILAAASLAPARPRLAEAHEP